MALRGRPGRALALGALGGVAGTLAMSGVMAAAHQTRALGEPPPRKITRALLDALGLGGRASGRTIDALALANHFAYGAGMGGLFGLGSLRVARRVSPVARGALFGGLVWLVSYVGWVPALGIMAPPSRDRPGRPTSMVLAHLVYGAVLGAVSGVPARSTDARRA